MFAEERQQLIAERIARQGRVSVTLLADEFSVTSETVRRDLSVLETDGLARRVHGGAIAPDFATVVETRLGDREETHVEEKRRIAQAAVAQLPTDGATVLLDAGTTTMRLVEALPTDCRLTVFTHAVPLAHRLATLPLVTLHLLPGRVRTSTHAAVGAETVAALAAIRADLAFIGTNGISVAHGLSTPDRDEAAVKAAMVASAHTSVVLADASKMGVERTVRFAALADVDAIVTDAEPPSDITKAVIDLGLEVVVA